MADQRSRQWLTPVDTLASHLEAGAPLTFVLGAGASITSNAPSSRRLEQCWMDSNPRAYPNRRALLAKLASLGDDEKINSIKPLFDSVQPFIGYHCLASLAQDRPVFVLNLNWDHALEQACEATSVPFRHLTLDRDGDLVFVEETRNGRRKTVRGRGREPDFLTRRPTPGVYCLQVHGKLGDRISGIRIGVYETLQFAPIVKQVIVKRFFAHPTVIVGASLQGEFDVVDLLRALTEDVAERREERSPIYVFSRQDERTSDPTDKLTQHVLYQRSSHRNFRGDPAVDFDRLLLDLASRIKGIDFHSPFPPDSIPTLEETALPDREVLSPPFHDSKHRAMVIEGDADLGRTVAAGLIGQMARLCDRQQPSIEIFSRPKQCLDAMQDLNAALKAGESPNRVLILENPFGTTGAFRENPAFARAFNSYLKSKPKARGDATTRVIITTRASNWRRALVEKPKVTAPPTTISAGIDDWYHVTELTAYLESKVARNDKPLLRRDIHKGELATPAAISDAVLGGSDRRAETIKEKTVFLREISDDAAWCAVLARLQELWPNGVADLPLHRSADRKSAAFEEAKLMLKTVDMDGQSYVVPAHSTDREAIDAFFAANHGRFEERLEELGRRHGSPRGACELWAAVRELREGKLDRVRKLPEDVRLNWGPALLEEAFRHPDPDEARERFTKVRELLLKDPQHFWSMRELVFETIRLWPMLKEDRVTLQFIRDVLGDGKVGGLSSERRMGRYLVLEAMLYVQAATYPGTWNLAAYTRIWEELAAVRHTLYDEPEKNIRELALMFDAFAWCPPRLEPNDLRRWLAPQLEVAEKCPRLQAAILCSSLLHPEGFELLVENMGEPGIRVEERRLTSEDAEIASFMISWHFIHQSRGRALLYRRSLEPNHAYLLHRIPDPQRPTLPAEIANRCTRVIREMCALSDHAGWAIHLAVSVAVQRKEFDVGFVASHIGRLRDGDPGAIAAVMTYNIPSDLRAAFLAYFDRTPNRDALLGALSTPREIDGVRIGPPPFCASRLPWQLYEKLEIEWAELEEDGIPVGDEYSFLEALHSTAGKLEREDCMDAQTVEALRAATREAASGDLRRLEGVHVHRRLVPSDGRVRMNGSDYLEYRLKRVADNIAKSSP